MREACVDIAAAADCASGLGCRHSTSWRRSDTRLHLLVFLPCLQLQRSTAAHWHGSSSCDALVGAGSSSSSRSSTCGSSSSRGCGSQRAPTKKAAAAVSSGGVPGCCCVCMVCNCRVSCASRVGDVPGSSSRRRAQQPSRQPARVDRDTEQQSVRSGLCRKENQQAAHQAACMTACCRAATRTDH